MFIALPTLCSLFHDTLAQGRENTTGPAWHPACTAWPFHDFPAHRRTFASTTWNYEVIGGSL